MEAFFTDNTVCQITITHYYRARAMTLKSKKDEWCVCCLSFRFPPRRKWELLPLRDLWRSMRQRRPWEQPSRRCWCVFWGGIGSISSSAIWIFALPSLYIGLLLKFTHCSNAVGGRRKKREGCRLCIIIPSVIGVCSLSLSPLCLCWGFRRVRRRLRMCWTTWRLTRPVWRPK